MTRRTRIVLAILNALFFILTIVVNGLANALPINGKNPVELSEMYPNLFVPAGVTFSIWGLIYLLLFAFIVYQLFEVLRIDRPKAFFIEEINFWFIVSCIANASWIVAWHYLYVWSSVGIMLTLFGSLLMIYLLLEIGRSEANSMVRYFVHLPFSVYLGWITVATIASITTLLVHTGWNGLGLSEQFWAAAMVIVATAIGLAVLFRRNDPFYAGVLVWAFAGIAYKRSLVEADDQAVFIAAIGCAILLFAGIFYQIVKKRTY